MTMLVLAAVGGLEWVALWAATDPGTDWLLTAFPQLGAIALLLWFGNRMLTAADKRTEAERVARMAAEDDSRAVRDAFIKEVVPTITLTTARSEDLLDGLRQVVALVERVVNASLERPR